MTPVILLTESYLGNGAEPWKVKTLDELADINPRELKITDTNWQPFHRDQEKLARDWVVPGVKGLQHRIGGLEKDECTGCVSHNPQNHEIMVQIRQEKVNRVADYISQQKYKGKDAKKLLVVGWGGQFGILLGAVGELQNEGRDIALTHFNYINPLPKNTAEIFSRFERILVCELNNGQFVNYLRSVLPQFKYKQYNKIQGLPFTVSELKEKFLKVLEEN